MTGSIRAPDVAETLLSWVFFTPDRAYKLLRPVEMPFLDHREAADRLRSVAREFELNRVICPDVYLGTADVIEDGEVADRMLVMRRLPAERRLSTLVDDPRFGYFLRAVARRVAALHASRQPVRDAPMARLPELAANWRENFDVIRPHVGRVIDAEEFDAVERRVTAYLDRRDDLLDARIDDGFVRDVHGDLTAEDIFCLDDGPRIVDCLAFNDRWRIIDVLNDIGFLVMDVHRLAGWQIAEQLMRWYQEFSNEHHPASLAHHYVTYRAHVRAKVACLRIGQGDAAQVDLARRYHSLARDHAERARIRLVLVGGGPGTGKTSLSAGIGAQLGCPVLSSDEVRKSVTGTPADTHRYAPPGEGIYDDTTVAAVYRELLREAEAVLRSGSGVVLDATWTRDVYRRAARAVAHRCGAELVELECRVAPEVARQRVARRRIDADGGSDATPEVVDHLAARREPWPEAHTLDTAAPADQTIATSVARIVELPLPGSEVTT